MFGCDRPVDVTSCCLPCLERELLSVSVVCSTQTEEKYLFRSWIPNVAVCIFEHISGFPTVDLIGWFRIDVCQGLSKHCLERFKVTLLIWERQKGQCNVSQHWYCNRRIVCLRSSAVVQRQGVIVCCCEMILCVCVCVCVRVCSSSSKDVLTKVGWCLYVTVFRVG